MAQRKAVDHKAKVERSLKVGNVEDVSGEVNIAAGDIIKTFNTIHERALTVAEEAAQARNIESKSLAQGVSELARTLATQASAGTESDNPYKGLLSYGLNEAENFYGREKAKNELLKRIKQSSLTVLYSESGAGKSSLLQAGIAAQLIAKGHLAVYIRPHNSDPVDAIKRMFLPELAQTPDLAKASLRKFLRDVSAVLGPTVNLYLLIDQFEEFFNLLRKDERQPFLQSLAECLNDPSLKVRWVLALRAEAFSDLSELEAFGITPFNNTYRLNRLSLSEAQEAIVEPAARYGIQFEPALVKHILNTLKGKGKDQDNDEVMPTHLQLVCSALMDDLPEGTPLITLDYFTKQEGGTEGILRDYLKRQLERLPGDEPALAAKVLRTLITSDGKRAVKTNNEIVQELKNSGMSSDQINVILSRLVQRRVLFSQSVTVETYELAHDYLIKEIELDPQEQARKAAQELLDQEARTYKRHRTLLSAERLAVIEPYQAELRLSADAETLLTESRKAVQQEKHVRILSIAGVIGLIIAGIVFFSFMSTSSAKKLAQQSKDSASTQVVLRTTAEAIAVTAEANAEEARKQARVARAGELAAESVNQRDVNFQVSLLLGLEAYKTNVTDQTEGTLLDNAQAKGELLKYLPNFNSSILAISPDGKMFAMDAGDGTVLLKNIDSRTTIGRPLTPEDDIGRRITFSQNGKLLASVNCIESDGQTCTKSEVVIWDVLAQQFITPFITKNNSIISLAFSMDGDLLLIGICQNWEDKGYNAFHCTEGEIEFWDLTTKQQTGQTLSGISTLGPGLAISPDKKLIAASVDSSGGGVTIWNAGTKQLVKQLLSDISVTGGLTSSATIDSISFSPDGSVLALAVYGDIELFNSSTFESLKSIKGDNSLEFINCLTFTPDSSTLISGSDRGNIIFWDWNQRTYLDPLGSGPIYSFLGGTYDSTTETAFGTDGKTIVTNGDQGVTLWDADSRQAIKTENNLDPAKLVFSPDGSMFASSDLDGVIILWDAKTLQPLMKNETGQSNSVGPMGFSADNNLLAVNINDSVLIWDVNTLQPIGKPMNPNGGYINSLAFSPNGKILASANENASVAFWDVKTHEPLGKPISGFSGEATSIAFSPDGKTIAIENENSKLTLWDVETRSLLHGAVNTGQEAWSAALAFSPNGRYLVSGSNDGTILLWNAQTLQHIGSPIGSGWGSVSSISFSPNGDMIAYSAGYTVLLNASPKYWINQICNRVGRNFTRAEWAQYFPKEDYRKTCEQWPLEPEITAIP